MPPVTFIYTNSLDLTADLLISRLGSEHIFRFNIDLWRDYQIKVDADGLFIQNPAGRSVHQSEIAKFYWRRPHTTARLYPQREIPKEICYIEEEISYALRDTLNLLWADGKVVLTEPMADSRIGKLVQLSLARKYFTVPDYRFVLGSADFLTETSAAVIVKSLSSERVNREKTLFTTQVNQQELDPQTPWFIQEYVPASHDITVVYIRGDLFAFELDRSPFVGQTADWREVAPEIAVDGWQPHQLPSELQDAIQGFMHDLGLHYGRLDLLLTTEGYRFLEVNANGEWAWLDFDNRHGLLERMANELSPLTPCHPIPINRQITR